MTNVYDTPRVVKYLANFIALSVTSGTVCTCYQKALFVKSLVFLSTVVDIMTKAAYLSLQVRAINLFSIKARCLCFN